MEQNKTGENKMQLLASDLLKLFLGKFKIIVIVGVIAAILGATLGGVFIYLTGNYVAEVSVYVSPVTDGNRLLFNLRSGRFAESLLLDEYGLPPKEICDPEDYEEALKAVKAFEAAREAKEQKYLEVVYYHIDDIESTYKILETEYSDALALLRLYKQADGEGFVNNEEHLAMIARCEEDLLKARAKKLEYYETYYLPAKEKQVRINFEYEALCDEVKITRSVRDKALEKVLAPWRNTLDAQQKISKILTNSDYDYFTYENPASNEKTDPNKEPELIVEKGFIKGVFTVPFDEKEFGLEVVEAYEAKMCEYIKKEVEEYTGQSSVECVLIDPSITLRPEKESMAYLLEVAKFGIAAAVAAGALTYLVFVSKMLIVKRKNKKAAE